MSERYKRLYSLTSNLYAEGSPVIIEAGSLLLDTQNGNVLAQLKFNSLSNRKIIALKVEVRSFDPAGREIGSPVYHQYLDLCVAMGGSFGAKVPVYLPDAGTRSFSAKATEVIFEDEDVWTGDENAQWTVLASQGKLNLGDPELTKEYRLKYGKQCEYTYLKEKDLWHCPCGAVNKEESCYRCKLLRAELDGFDMEALKQSCEERLRNEEIARKDAILAEGKAKMTGESVSNYESAIKLFEQISGWKDADEQLSICQRKIEEIDLAHKRRIEIARKEAERKAKRNKKIAIIATPIVCAIIAFVIVLNIVIIPNFKYNKAVALMETDVVKAYEALVALNGYKDTEELANSIYIKYKIEKFKTANVGDYVSFGVYEQDNNTDNNSEKIEWLVLDKQDDKMLVISKYALDYSKYNTSYAAETWETCSLRSWLNDDFLNDAFSADEQVVIQTTTVPADKNPEYVTKPGNETKDKIFILSITEANKYFAHDGARNCAATECAKAHGVRVHSYFKADGKAACQWWLRSPGRSEVYAACVDGDGDIDERGIKIDSEGIAFRPAMWIKLDS